MRYQYILFFFLFSLSSQVFSDTHSTPPTVHLALLNDFKTEKVADHTYVIHGPDRAKLKENQAFVNNPAFIITSNSVIVIDPGSSVQIGRALIQHIRKLTDKPISHVFNTHMHGDHWLGNHAFSEENSDVLIYAHPIMIEEMQAGGGKSWLDSLTKITDGSIKGTNIISPNTPLKDQQTITIDDITIKAHLFEWAHTKTDVMLEVVEDKLLFTGDIVNNQRIIPFDEGSFSGSHEAIAKAMLLDIKTVIPGHGATSDSGLLKTYQTGLASIYQTVKTLREDDLEPYEMKDQVLSSATEFKNWEGLEEELGRYLSLAALEAEQEDF